MALSIRAKIAAKLLQCLGKISPVLENGPYLPPLIKIVREYEDGIKFFVPLKIIHDSVHPERISNLVNLENYGLEVCKNFSPDETLKKMYLGTNKFALCACFSVDDSVVRKEALSSVLLHPLSFWRCGDITKNISHKKIIVEFSSPNIAKEFHVGHLRSTIIGNFVANINESVGHDVVRLNFLGDWGTQIGLLKYGFDSSNMALDELKTDAIQKLYQIYVSANKLSENDPVVMEEARRICCLMEEGDKETLEKWNFFRDITIKELEDTYARLNVKFDEYHFESAYGTDKSEAVTELLLEKGIVRKLKDGHVIYQLNPLSIVTVRKSDGSSLYVTRDIAAAIDRYERYKFDDMYYVVDNGQANHFIALFCILKDISSDWADRLHHIKFGRLEGMSTRKGTSVFLKDVLDEARALMLERQKQSPTTKQSLHFSSEETAEKVAISSIIINDMKQRRQKNYSFNWDNVLQSEGNTGIKLQYAHCRLVNLERNCMVQFNPDADLNLLREPEALRLIISIARFEEVLWESYCDLDPSIIVNYLFGLCRCINGAFMSLNVKSAKSDIAEARLVLFVAARHVLAAGMKILGLQPLEQM